MLLGHVHAAGGRSRGRRAPRASAPPASTFAGVVHVVLGLSLLAGMEAMTALRDACRLSPEDALAVTDWAARPSSTPP